MISNLLRAGATPTILIAGFAASPANAQSRFAIVGDMGSSTAATSVAKLIKDRGTEHVFTTGDNCYGRTPISTQIGSNYSSFVVARRFWPSLGNHDYSDACGNRSLAYLAYFNLPGNERYYDVRLGAVHFFVVNSDNREPNGISASSRQAQWFKRRIQASGAPWQVVVMHHPPYSSGEHGSTAAVRWPFEQWGVDAVLNGHDHNYERILRDDNRDGRKLPYFISGLGGRGKDPIPGNVEGSAFRYSAEFGALFLNASQQQLKFEFRNIRGTVVDSYIVSK
jgi:tartrate-resistant acid phosphatase type 5